jgi:Ca2+-binding EF-hand superfamily protein
MATTTKSPERRRKRTPLSEVDQDLLDHIRQAFAEHSGRGGVIRAGNLSTLLHIGDPSVSKRVVELFAGNGATEVQADAFRDGIIRLVLGSEREKMRFVFDLNDQDGDGAIGKRDIEKLVATTVRASKLRMDPRERKRLGRTLFNEADRKGDGTIDFAEFQQLLRRYPAIRNALAKSVAA